MLIDKINITQVPTEELKPAHYNPRQSSDKSYQKNFKHTCRYCGKKLICKVWYGKRKYKESSKRFNERKYCGSECRYKQLSIDSKGAGNFFYDKKLIPWNFGNRVLLWKSKDSQGYIRIFKRHKNGKVTFRYEHRIIWEKVIDEKLTKKDIIHHINGQRNDNRIENLLKCSCKEHRKLHSKAKENYAI